MGVKIQPKLLKGTRDFLPDMMIKRNYVIDIIRDIFKTHGFLPLETPSIEMYETLAGKYGEEGEQLIYRFKDRGERDLGLRYDLTVPLSRVVAMHQNNLVFPLKRFQIQPVWRADKPGKGRFREFYQCDVDIVGSKDLLADAEVIYLFSRAMQKLGFKGYKIKINHRKVLRGIVEVAGCDVSRESDICIAIDKLDKIGFEGVEQELGKRGISSASSAEILKAIKIKGEPREVIARGNSLLEKSDSAGIGFDELSTLGNLLLAMGMPPDNFEFDISLARGLNYYTGPIFETVVEEPRIGSVSGGGRYDNLVGQFLGRDMPAVGNSIGLERIITVMDELNMYPAGLGYGIDVMICRFADEDTDYIVNLANKYRKAGLRTEIYLGSKKKKLRAQLGYA
ncbi:MAG: histidine--tRNA ligase, partial [Vulcanimicrobiota bacterium]